MLTHQGMNRVQMEIIIMKNPYRNFLYIICIFILTLIGCVSSKTSHDPEQLFVEMYKDCSMNKDLRLSPEKPIYEGGEDVFLLLESISDSSVIFPAGYNFQLLQFDTGEGKWVEKENHAQYLPLDGRKIFGKNNPNNIGYAQKFIPINPIVNEKTSLRVALHGHIYKDGVETEQCSGAFTDIVVLP